MTTTGQSTRAPGWIKLAGFAVLAVVLVLFFVYQWQTARQRQESLEQQAELIQQQQSSLDQQQLLIEKQIQTVDSVVGEYEGHLEQQKAEQQMAELLRAKQMNFAYVASGLALASNLKMQVTEHYMIEGRFPTSNQELGLPAPKQMGGRGVESIAITRNGAIRVVYGADSGVEGGALLMQPEAKDQAGRIDWKCTTTDYPDIASVLPTCHHVASE